MQQGKERVGQMERIALTYICTIVCKIAGGKLLYNRDLSSGLCSHLDGWDGGIGRQAQEGELRVYM